MKRIGIVAPCLVAALATSALAAASASAEPQYRSCVKATYKVGKTYKDGTFEDKECTKPLAGGPYKLVAVQPRTEFTGKSKGATFTAEVEVADTETGEPLAVTCKKATDTGTIVAPEVSKETFTFEKCVVKGTTTPCGTAGTIKSQPQESEPFFANSHRETVVELFVPAGAPYYFASFECAARKVTLYGFAIATVTGDVNKAGKTYTLTFATSATTQKQEPQHLWYPPEEREVGPFSLYTRIGRGTAETEPEATLASAFEQKWNEGAIEIAT